MFEITQSEKDQKFYFVLKAKNGQVIIRSQGYAGKPGCKNGIESVKKNAGNNELYERKEASNGKSFFNLLATNKQIIGTSQMYASKDGMEKGIESVKNNAPGAGVKDTTVAS